jgi:hypothetical protein
MRRKKRVGANWRRDDLAEVPIQDGLALTGRWTCEMGREKSAC